MKVCPKCHVEQDESEFTKNKRNKDGLETYCKECRRNHYVEHKDHIKEKSKANYRENINKHREYGRKWAKNNYPKTKEYRIKLINSFKTPCVKCGESRLNVIQFHHIIPKEVGKKTVASLSSRTKIKQEVEKCVCLCANCHMDFHQLYGNNPEYKKEQLEEYIRGSIAVEYDQK